MESLLDPFSGLRFVTTRHTRAYFPSSFPLMGIQSHHLFTFVAFRVGVQSRRSRSQFDIQSHWSVWRSEPSFIVWHSESSFSFFSLAFRAIGQFGIQSHRSQFLGVRSHIHQFGVQSCRSGSQFGIQSHRSQFGVQSHLFEFRCLEPSLLVLGIQSHLFQFQAFRAISFSFRLSESSFLVQVFRSISLSLGIQSHLFRFWAVRATSYNFRHLELFPSVQAFEAISFNLGAQSHLAFRATLLNLGI